MGGGGGGSPISYIMMHLLYLVGSWYKQLPLGMPLEWDKITTSH